MGTNQSVTYTNWAAYQPDNFSGFEKCIQIYGSGQWNDMRCAREFYFICEKLTDYENNGNENKICN